MLPQPRAPPGDPASSKDTSPMDVPGRGSLPPWNSTTSICHPTSPGCKVFLLLAAFKEKSRLPFCLLSDGFGGQGPSLSYPALRAAPGSTGPQGHCGEAGSFQHSPLLLAPTWGLTVRAGKRALCAPRGSPN